MFHEKSVYLITGGASGLGKSLAESLLEEGACLTILDIRNFTENNSLYEHCERILYLQVDITSEKDVKNAFDATKRKFGKLNGVINCAGMCIKSSLFDNETGEMHSIPLFMKVINVNLIGTFNITRLAIENLLENEPGFSGDRGFIINISSVLGHKGHPQFLAYSASEAGIIALTSSLAEEVKKYGIRIVDIAPGSFSPITKEQHHKDFVYLVKKVMGNSRLNGVSLKIDNS